MNELKTVTIEELRRQTNALPDDDDLLQIYGEAAEGKVLDDINREDFSSLTDADGNVPAQISQAVRLLVGHWYRNREAETTVNMYKLPLGYESLLKKYRYFDPDWRKI